ncbi:MAG: hypothetical protein IH897_16675 [Planctomycetes bacterium]|nr:hypothetical protein [Planctomycetota bacterium]
MSREHIPNELRLWYERSSDGEPGECKSQPPFHELVAWIGGRGELSAYDAAHLESCPRCQRAVAAIRRELTDMESKTANRVSLEEGIRKTIAWYRQSLPGNAI